MIIRLFKNIRLRLFINAILIIHILFIFYYMELYTTGLTEYRYIFILFVYIISIWIIINVFANKTYFFIALFFIANLAFMYGRILISPIGEVRGLFFAPYFFSSDTNLFIIKCLYLNLLGIVIGLFLIDLFSKINKKNTKRIKTYTMTKDKTFSIYLLWILVVGTIVYVFFLVDKVSILYLSGYLEARMYDNIYFAVYGLLIVPFILLGLSLNIPVNIKKIFLYLLLFNGIMSGFQGARGGFVISILFYLWVKAYIFNEKINPLKIIIIIFILISLVSIFSFLRSGSDGYIGLSFIDTILILLNEQGSSVGIIGYYNDYQKISSNHHTVPFLFGVFDNFYLKLFNPDIYNLNATKANFGEFSSILGQRISAIMNPGLYEDGAGLGGNYIVEMYDFLGYLGIIVFTAVYIFILNYLQKSFLYNDSILKKIFALEFLYFSLFMPRTHYLTIGITQVISILIVYIVYRSYGNFFKINYLNRNKL